MPDPKWTTHLETFKWLCVVGPQSSFGSVSKALHTVTNLEVAIKKIDIEISLRFFKGNVTNLFQEVELLSRIDHSNIVKYGYSWLEGPDIPNIIAKRDEVLSLGETFLGTSKESSNFIFLQMELCEGSLEDYLRAQENAHERTNKQLDIAIQLTSALKHIHELGIIHQDLKLGNILRIGDTFKIGDFGLSDRSVGDNAIGTRTYWSPELYLREGNSMASDVFALGVIFLQLLFFPIPLPLFKVSYTGKLTTGTCSFDIEGRGKSVPPELIKMLNTSLEMVKMEKESRPSANSVLELLTDANPRLQPTQHMYASGQDRDNVNIEPPIKDIWFDVLPPVEHFTGRTEKLQEIHGHVENIKQEGGFVVLSGLGGIGKTNLVRKYVKDHSTDFQGNVVWVHAHTRFSLSTSFTKLGQRLGVVSSEKMETSEIVSNCYAHLRNTPVLFVFDNAETLRGELDGIEDFLPPSTPKDSTSSKPVFILTTRNRDIITGKSVRNVTLDVFTKAESQTFIEDSLSELDSEPKPEEISDLGETLQYFPLAEQQAISFIKEESKLRSLIGESFTIRNYLDRYQMEAEKLLDFQIPDNCLENQYHKTTYITWNITFERIKEQKEDGELAVHILSLLSYLLPDHVDAYMILEIADPVSDIILSMKGCEGDPAELLALNLRALNLIHQYSMSNVFGGEINTHRLVQTIIRLNIRKENGEEGILSQILEYFKKYYETYNGHPHTGQIICAWNHTTSSTAANSLIRKFEKLPFKIDLDLGNAKNLLREELEFKLKTLPKYEECLGRGATLVNYMKSSIGFSYQLCGKFEDALRLHREVAQDIRETDGEFSVKHIQAELEVGSTLSLIGRTAEASEHIQKVLQMGKDKMELKEHGFYKIYLELANNYRKELKRDLAVCILEEALDMEMKNLPQEDDQTKQLILLTKTRLGSVFREQNKFKEAYDIFLKVADGYAELYGPQHPQSINAKSCMAYTLQDQGKYLEALEILENVYILDSEETSVPDCPKPNTRLKSGVIVTWNSIAWLCFRLGKWERGLRICDQLIEYLNITFGEDNPSTLITKHSKAHLLLLSGNAEEALDLHKYVYRSRQEIFGEKDYCTASSNFGVGLALKSLGRLNEAAEVLKSVVRIQEEQLGKENINTLETKLALGQVYIEKADWNKGLSLLNAVMATFEKVFGTENYWTMCATERVAEAQRLTGQLEESLQCYEKLCQISETLLGTEHPLHAVRIHNKDAVKSLLQQKSEDMPHSPENLTNRIENLNIFESQGNAGMHKQ